MSGRNDRKDPRYRVHLQVRFERAADFVIEYAENLSRGGLFVVGAHELESRTEVAIELDLPGLGRFRVTGEVAHILDADTAKALGRSPGAGIAIVERPEGFDDALSVYLMRLGRRADAMVIASDEHCGRLLAAAGFQVTTVTSAGALVAAVVRAEVPVLAVVVDPATAAAFREAAAGAGADDLVVELGRGEPFDSLLVRLDERL